VQTLHDFSSYWGHPFSIGVSAYSERPVLQGFGFDRYRTALTRACTAAGVPTFSPHDLRHRRISLLHLSNVPWARIGEQVGHDDLVTTARTYTHVLVDERDLDYVAFAIPEHYGTSSAKSAVWLRRSELDVSMEAHLSTAPGTEH